MKEKFILKRVSVLFIACFLMVVMSHAQQSDSKATSRTISAQQPTSKEAAATKSASDAVYYNYKGITDLNQAKIAWIKDNEPELYKKLGQPAIVTEDTKRAEEKAAAKAAPNTR